MCGCEAFIQIYKEGVGGPVFICDEKIKANNLRCQLGTTSIVSKISAGLIPG